MADLRLGADLSRADLIQHAAVGGLICGLTVLLLAPAVVAPQHAAGLGLLLAGAAGAGREVWQRIARAGTPDPADAAATYAGAIAVALTAQLSLT